MRGLLLLGHGSRRREANEIVELVAAAFLERAEFAAVQPAFLEIARPSIRLGYRLLVDEGCDEIVAMPYFLFGGNHTRVDIPRELAQAQAELPHTRWVLAEPLGLHPALLDVVHDRIEAALAVSAPVPGALSAR